MSDTMKSNLEILSGPAKGPESNRCDNRQMIGL